MDFPALASGGVEVEEQLRRMERAIDDLNVALIEIKSNPPKDSHTRKQQQLRIQTLKQELLPGEMSELLKRQQKLQQQFDSVSSECDAHLVSVSTQQLLERYDRNHGSPQVDTLSLNPQQQRQQVVKMGDQTQDQAQASLIRTQQMVAETEDVGGAILQKMQQQNEQLESVREGLDDVEQNVSRAKKTAQTIAKNAANDRCMQCLCCCVTLLAIASIVLIALPGPRS